MVSTITSYITSLLEKKQEIPKGADINSFRFMESGHIDSLGVMKFILQLEDKFGIDIGDEDMLSESFRTVGGLSKLITEKMNTSEDK